jgi:hypothetical protein
MDELVQKILGGRRSKRHEGHPKVDLRAYMGRIHGGVEAQTIDEPVDDLAGGSAELEAGQTVYIAKNGSKYVKDKRGRPRFISGSNKAYMKKIRSKPRKSKKHSKRK